MTKTVHLGFELETGRRVEIPLAHTFVTGQTQLSGKTTALRAIVERSGRRALIFVTKRGETFEGRRIRPYLPREGHEPIHWRLVETIVASALGQRNLKYERLQLIRAAKGAMSLEGVRANVAGILRKTKSPRGAEVYELLGEYLDLILPEMRQLGAVDVLQLDPGLNVMDLAGVGAILQALIIRAALERINRHEEHVLTVFPEAWEFAPRSRSAPAKDEAIAMARKGAVLNNFLLCDSQDLAGVDTVVRQAASVYILGVQRELNELKRTIDTIPAGIRRPKAQDVATLQLGQFYACWGAHAIKTYVQPAWMDETVAHAIATGAVEVKHYRPPIRGARTIVQQGGSSDVTNEQADALRAENEQLRRDVRALEQKLEAALRRSQETPADVETPRELQRSSAASERRDPPSHRASGGAVSRAEAGESETARADEDLDTLAKLGIEVEKLYALFERRLMARSPALVLEIAQARPELSIAVKREVISADGSSLRGRVGLLISEGWFDQGRGGTQTQRELARRGKDPGPGNMYAELDALAELGFLTIEQGKDTSGRARKEYRVVGAMKVNVRQVA